MAATIAETLLSLDQYAQILGIPPVHFAQGVSAAYPDDGGCRSVWFQYDWQSPGKASREGLARAIAQAESMIAQLTGFWPAPKWIEEEVRPFPRQRLMVDGIGRAFYPAFATGRRKTVGARWGRFIAGGRRRLTLVAEGAGVMYPADLSNGVAEISVVWDASFPLSASEVAVFPSGCTSANLQIRELAVSVEPDEIVIRGHPARFFDPTLWEDAEAIDADNPLSYQEGVDVYRVYTSSEGEAYAPVEFGWQTLTSAASTIGYGLLQEWNSQAGIVCPVPTTWDETLEEWQVGAFSPGVEPNTMQLFYQAGWPRDQLGRVAEPFAQAIAALATALLVEPICGCANAEKLSGRWQRTPQERELVSFKQLDCPWGNQLGAFDAYKMLSAFYGGAGGMSL
uniref:Uncharacterized protein n=1 Tax=viral metagenome TaxID=1070528 RepID=A0A6M3J3H7_9ZZZZ